MDLKVLKRDILGKKVENLRNSGLIPAELYGHGVENVHLSVEAKEFFKVFKEAGETTLVNLNLENKKVPVLIYEVSNDSLTNEPMHIDFYAVKMDEKITTFVPLEFIGDAPAVKEKQGVLIKAMQQIEVEALPADLPHHIEVKLDELLEIGANVYVKDLSIPKGVEILVAPESVVATIVEQAKEEVEEKPMSVEEVKVEGEEKKAEAETEKASEAETK